MRYEYKVYKIGDGLFSTYSTFKNEKLVGKSIFDIGYSKQGLFNGINSSEYSDSKTLVLSHFHRDHWKGLDQIPNSSLCLENVVIPRLPSNELYAKGVVAFTTIQLFYHARRTGFYETDILNLIARKNSCNFKVERLARGENFKASEEKFDIIWPDPKFLVNLQVVEDALADISKIAEQNEGFNDFYQRVINSGTFNLDIIEVSPAEDDPVDFEIKLTTTQSELLRSANRKLLGKANDICLAFHDGNRKFLFLGDLSNTALNSLFSDDFKVPSLYEVILSAHHGTHYSSLSTWKNIKSCVVVHSNGKRMKHYFREEYNSWSVNQHQTEFNGEFNSLPYLRNCSISKLLTEMDKSKKEILSKK
jgi:beta-lactamase superfamily II metal-dependent hydrolase